MAYGGQKVARKTRDPSVYAFKEVRLTKKLAKECVVCPKAKLRETT